MSACLSTALVIWGCLCGCVWVSMQAVPSLRQSRGFQIQWREGRAAVAHKCTLRIPLCLTSAVKLQLLHILLENQKILVVPSCSTRCKVGSMPNGFQVPTRLVLNNCQLWQMCVFPVSGFIWLSDSSPSLPKLIYGSNICRTCSLVLAGGCISAVSEECILSSFYKFL